MIALSKLKLKTVNPRNQLNTHFFSLSLSKNRQKLKSILKRGNLKRFS